MNEFIKNKDNPLQIGINTLNELEEKVKAFRIMNLTSLKKDLYYQEKLFIYLIRKRLF